MVDNSKKRLYRFALMMLDLSQRLRLMPRNLLRPCLCGFDDFVLKRFNLASREDPDWKIGHWGPSPHEDSSAPDIDTDRRSNTPVPRPTVQTDKRVSDGRKYLFGTSSIMQLTDF